MTNTVSVSKLARRITNKLNLPLPIVEAVQNDPYSSGDSDYTPTSLLQPARQRRLLALYPAETVEDVADCLYRLHGQAVHLLLERAANRLTEQGYIVEKRFYGTIAHRGRIWKVSAQVDLYDPETGTLQDYKTSSVFSLAYGPKDEHTKQLNLQRWLVQQQGLPVNILEIVGIFRDWSKKKAQYDDSYPQAPAIKQTHEILSDEEVIAWAKNRIDAHEDSTQELPLCTDEETWARVDDDSFAVRKPGNQKASKVCDTRAEAEAYIASKPGQGLYIEERFGESERCARYCPAASVCEQWKNSPRNKELKIAQPSEAVVLDDGTELVSMRSK